MSWIHCGSNAIQIDGKGDLDIEEKLVEEQFANWIQEDVDRAVREYADLPDTDNGMVVDTDHARELSDIYSQSWESRLEWGDAVHEPASALAKEVYRRRLEGPLLQEDRVLFMAGGPGSGKTTAVEKRLGEVVSKVDAVYDSTFASESSATDKIDASLNSGKTPLVFYIHRPADLAAELIFERGLKTGRIVPAEIAAESHFESQKTLLSLKASRGNEIVIRVLDNSGDVGDIYETSVQAIREAEYSDPKSVLTLVKEGLSHARQKHRHNSRAERVHAKILGG